MRRIRNLVGLLLLVPNGAMAQSDVALIERDSTRESILALEKSRQALIEARESIDAALGEVDQALSLLRPPQGRRVLVRGASSPPAAFPGAGSMGSDILGSVGRGLDSLRAGSRSMLIYLHGAAARLGLRAAPGVRAQDPKDDSGIADLAGGPAPAVLKESASPPIAQEAFEVGRAAPRDLQDALLTAAATEPEAEPSAGTREAAKEREHAEATALEAARRDPSAPDPGSPRLPVVDGVQPAISLERL